MTRPSLKTATGLALLGLLAACGQKPVKTEPKPVVVVSHPLAEKIVDWDDYVGHFEAMDQVDIRPRVSGYLESIAFRDGDFVKKGQLLFVIDKRPYRAAADAARANLARAKATAANAAAEKARAEALFAAKAVSQQELASRTALADQTKADVDAAAAALAAAELNLSFTEVKAPMAGRISDRRVAPGNLVTADQTVLTSLVNLNPIRFVFSGAEDVYLKYQRQNLEGVRKSSRTAPNPVEVRLEDEPDYRWRGHMDFVDNTVDPRSGTIRGRAVIANPDNFLTPGLFGHLKLLGSGAYDGLVLPDQAIVTDQSRLAVYVVDKDGEVSEKLVETGPLYHGLRVIRSGLTADDLVIIDGVQRAKPGRKVKPTPGKIISDHPLEPAEAPGGQSPSRQPVKSQPPKSAGSAGAL
jgi:RND family efflux transporter MFP subunit